MVDQVEISNVGGPKGVASEATLAALVKAMNARTDGSAKAIKLESMARQAFTKKITGEGTLVGKAFKSVASSATGFVNELFQGSGRLSDFSDAVLGTNNILTKSFSAFAHFVDDNVDSLRDLSSVGASFNNSIFDMRAAATASAMTFTEFAELVKENSALLARLGGTTSSGARAFGEFSKSVRTSRVGKELMGMGFTISEINEGLTSYLDLQLRSGREINLRDKNLARASQEYLFQLDRLAKLTGKQREQIADDMAKQIQDAGIRRQLNALTGEQQANLRGTLQFMDEMMPGLAGGFRDLMDGVAQTDLGKALATQIPDLQPLLEDVFAGNISETEFIEELKKFGPEIAAIQSQFSKEQLDAMRNAGGLTSVIAEMVDSLHELNSVTQMNTAELDKEAKQRSKLTELFGSFEQIVLEARTAITDAFLNSAAFDALKAFGDDLLGLVNTDGTLTKFKEVVTTVSNTLFGEDGLLTRAVKSVHRAVGGFIDDMKDGKTFSESVANMMSKLGEDIAYAWNQFWSGPIGTKIADTITGFWDDLMIKLLDSINQYLGIFVDDMSIITREHERFLKENQKAATPQERRQQIADRIAELQMKREDSEYMFGIDSEETEEIDRQIEQLQRSLEEVPGVPVSPPTRRIGTLRATSKPAEPRDALMEVHRGERVLNAQETAEYNSSKNSQTELLRKVDQLNTTMMTVARILESGLDVQTKTMRNLKTVNGDFMKGIGR